MIIGTNVKLYKKSLIKGRFFLIWLLGCVIIISRRSGILFDAQLWAEDGFIFLDEAILHGWQSIVIPYAGYIHVVPRIITYLSLQLSEILGQGIVWVPTIMNACTIALSSLCAVYICSSKFHWIGGIYFRMLLSFFILVFPEAYEIFGNVTNIQWWLGILEFFLLWNVLQSKKIPDWSDTILLSIVVISSPNGLIVLPALLWGYFCVNKNKLNFGALKIFLILTLTLVQVKFLLATRIPKEIDIALFLKKTIGSVLNHLFGNLLLGQSVNTLVLSITGAFLLLVVLFFSRRLFNKLYIPFAFLCSIIFITIFGSERISSRYIFLPTVVLFSILMYEGREQWRERAENIFSIAKIVLFALFFLLISLRIIKNYEIAPHFSFPWKKQAALYDPQGKISFCFPINPCDWSVSIPSLCDREGYIPRFLTKIPIDNSAITETHDMVVKDNLYMVTGSNPFVIYQLPDTLKVSCCWMDFDRSIEHLQLVFVCGYPDNVYLPNKYYPMLFNVSENNLMNMNGLIQDKGMNHLIIHFYNTLYHGAYSLQDSSFVIKRFELYTFPTE
jgi:hypothetical protein